MDRRKTNDTFHLFSRIKMKRIKNADLNGSQRIHKEYSTYSSDPATFVRFEKIAECLETNAFSIATNREYRIEQRPRKKQVKMARRKMAEIAVAKFECCSRNLAKKTRMNEWIRRRRRRKQGCFSLSLFLFFFQCFFYVNVSLERPAAAVALRSGAQSDWPMKKKTAKFSAANAD